MEIRTSRKSSKKMHKFAFFLAMGAKTVKINVDKQIMPVNTLSGGAYDRYETGG
jgi:hypothetical protein